MSHCAQCGHGKAIRPEHRSKLESPETGLACITDGRRGGRCWLYGRESPQASRF